MFDSMIPALILVIVAVVVIALAYGCWQSHQPPKTETRQKPPRK